MGRREGDLARFCCLVFLLMIYGSGGLSVSSPFAISPSSTNQDLLAAPPHSVESRNIQAPSPVILPIGSVAHPPVIPPSKSEVASPMVQGIVPSAQLSSPPYHSMSVSVSTSPSIHTQSPSAVSPIILSSAPSISISPLNPAINEHKSPRLKSQPHAYQAPDIFHSSDHDLSPSHVNPPSIQVRNGTPSRDTWRKLPNGSQLTLPHAAAPAPTIVPFSPPGVQPNVPKLAPSMTLPPGAKELSGPAVTPVVAPTTGTSNHLSPTNNSQIDGSSPAISPMPLESNVTHAPSTMHPHSPEGTITASPMLAPEISIPGHEDGKRGGNPTLVPSYPSGPYFPPVQAPVFSPSDEKAAITQSPLTPRRHNRWPIHYPVPSPSTFFKRSQSPLPQSIHVLPPSPPNFGPAVSPVVAPTTGTSTHLSPTNNSQFDGHAPSTMHSHSAEGRITASPMLAPEISIPRHEDGKRGENPTLAPSYPSASPHPSAPFENNRRGHYPPTAFVQAPVVSPAHHPSPIPNDNRNYIPPVISPAPFFPSPWNKGRFRTPPFVISPAPGNPPTENPKHRIRHLAPPPCVEGPEVHPTPSHHPTPFSKNNRRPHAPSPYVDGPVVIPSPSHPPMDIQRSKKNHHTPPSYHQGPYFPPVQAPFFSPSGEKAVTPTQSPLTPQRHNRWPIHYPVPAPSTYSKRPRSPLRSIHALPPSPPNFGPIHYPALSPSTYSIGSQSPLLQPIQALPPPPPNLDCGPITCQEPLANPPPASPCTCVLPIKVGLRLGVALYTFFPLVSEFAQEISSGIFMKQSQVRIMGANAASEDPEKTVVLIDLVPLGKYFDNTTVILTYVKFWHKQVAIQPSYFGDYDVLYVQYPGLPPSPPSAPGYINVNGGAYSSSNNARAIQPLGVDVRKQKGKLSRSLIAIIVLSSVMASFLIVGAACFLLLRRREHPDLPAASSQPLQTHLPKPSASGTAPMTAGGSVPSSTSASFSSSIATLAGSAKSYSLVEMEKATNKFDDSKIIGEGGFGRVYLGILEDGARVAVKVLKRDDHQGSREFLAEVEMLSRLHHRNLVKLMGICTEENARCLVYELIPNGSLESHLHGVDKEVSPLDWNTRMKIALGAARGLAYLHEDSSPRVIHRDFKSSNILLEHDFTPKVSDFGLARTALDEGNVHISTRVMGTFGYVAPEYAMTGHLLVKSDVYSYGVVLLELLTGRKPVDMSQPLGQENLVSWARPLLTKAEGLEMLIDPALGTNYPHDSIAKVAAIAAMCVHPEVSHRPFMGEVVQALKLVCSESDESRHSESCSNEETSTRATDTRINIGLCQGPEMIGSSQSVMFYTSAGFTGDVSGLLPMHSSSGPLRTGRGSHFWHRLRELASGSVSEHHRFAHRFWTSRSEHSERWP